VSDTTFGLIATIVKLLIVVNALMLTVSAMTWVERRVSAWIQDRVGPNRVGPFGLLQPIADGVKFIMKEDIIPMAAHKPLFTLAPALSLIPALCAFAVIPFGPTVELFGHSVSLVIVDLNGGILFAFAAASLGVYGIVCAGWASKNKYSLMGGLRASAQMISVRAGALALRDGRDPGVGHDAPDGDRRAAGGLVLELERVPRRLAAAGLPDLPGRGVRRDESRPVRPARGRERAGRRLSHRVLVDEVRDVLHGRVHQHDDLLGARGDALPGGLAARDSRSRSRLAAVDPADPRLRAQGSFFMFVYVWVRWTLPRFRYDQLMDIGWKGSSPIALANVMVTALLVAFGIVGR
jgi:NADH-quinone oxidoreductase subunit H